MYVCSCHWWTFFWQWYTILKVLFDWNSTQNLGYHDFFLLCFSGKARDILLPQSRLSQFYQELASPSYKSQYFQIGTTKQSVSIKHNQLKTFQFTIKHTIQFQHQDSKILFAIVANRSSSSSSIACLEESSCWSSDLFSFSFSICSLALKNK